MNLCASMCCQAISKAMKSPNKTANKPSKVYVVTRKTKAGSVGNKGGGKVSPFVVD